MFFFASQQGPKRIATPNRLENELHSLLHPIGCAAKKFLDSAALKISTRWIFGSRHRLPDMHPIRSRSPHRLSRLNPEGFVELGDVRQRSDHSPFGRGVDVAEEGSAEGFGAGLV